MKKIYQTTSKHGRELEKEFTSEERAEADLWANNYYNGMIVTEDVEDSEYASLLLSEKEEDEDGEFESNFRKHKIYLIGLEHSWYKSKQGLTYWKQALYWSILKTRTKTMKIEIHLHKENGKCSYKISVGDKLIDADDNYNTTNDLLSDCLNSPELREIVNTELKE